MSPQVSFVVAAWNTERTIRRSIKSALSQTRGDLEVIIVDDGSTDRTAAIVGSLVDPRVRLIPLDRNLGRAHARNVGIFESHGEFIAVLDADDECLPDRLRHSLAIFDQFPGAGVVGGQMLVRRRHSVEASLDWPTSPLAIRRELIAGRMSIAHPTILFRRSALESVGGYDARLRWAEDFDLLRRLASKYEMRASPNPLTIYSRRSVDSLRYTYRTELSRLQIVGMQDGSDTSLALQRIAAGKLSVTTLMRQALRMAVRAGIPNGSPATQ